MANENETKQSSSEYGPYRVYGFNANGSDRVPEPGKENEYIIYQPSQPYDDDVYAVSWTDHRWEWRVAGLCPFGEPKRELDENSARIILEHFGLLNYTGDFDPDKLQTLSPKDLIKESKKQAILSKYTFGKLS